MPPERFIPCIRTVYRLNGGFFMDSIMGIYIPDGYYLMARKESWIDHQPPYTREIFRYFIRMANHTDSKTLKKGQLLCTYNKIIAALSWFVGYRKMAYKKHQCENAMKQLKRAGMIATAKTTRGMIVTVCNYETYQTPKNYESRNHKRLPKAATEPQTTDTINKNVKNLKKKKAFTPPTLKEVQDYIKEKGYSVDGEKFFRFFTESEPKWVDSRGNKVRSWKQKIITWDGRNGRNSKSTKQDFREQESKYGQTI